MPDQDTGAGNVIESCLLNGKQAHSALGSRLWGIEMLEHVDVQGCFPSETDRDGKRAFNIRAASLSFALLFPNSVNKPSCLIARDAIGTHQARYLR